MEIVQQSHGKWIQVVWTWGLTRTQTIRRCDGNNSGNRGPSQIIDGLECSNRHFALDLVGTREPLKVLEQGSQKHRPALL